MAAFLQRLAASDRRLLWLDDTEYAAGLLANGVPPWLDSAAFVAWRRKTQSLLRSDVVALPVGPLCAAWLTNDPQLLASMAARRRANYPLKTLLTSAGLRRHVAELLAGLRSAFPELMLALVCPSPRAWVGAAYTAVFADLAPIEVGEEEVDAATLHCADFLRAFAVSGIDTVLLEESAQSEPANPTELDWYRAILNVGAHYRWDIGLQMPGSRFVGAVESSGFAFLIGPRSVPCACFGQCVPDSFWRGEGYVPVPEAAFRFARIPLQLEPELALDCIRELKSS